MKVFEIAKLIEKTAPKNLAYQWDNVGLLVGDRNKEIQSVYITLDTNLTTVKEAVYLGADMIISHHPIMFSPINRIDYSTPQGLLIKELITNDLPLYAAHTNMDTAKGGINDVLGNKLGLFDICVLDMHTDDKEAGLGRYGKIKPQKLSDFCETVKSALNTPIRCCGDDNMIISKAAVGSGACSELVPIAKEKGCDVLVTADMKYHQMIDAYEMGISVIDAGHYPTEVFVIDIFADILKDTDLKILKSTNADIFKFMV